MEKTMLKRWQLVAALLVAMLALAVGCKPADRPAGDQTAAPTASPAAKPWDKQAPGAIDAGFKFLMSQREDDGSWRHHPGITGIVVLSMLKSRRGYNAAEDPFIRKPVQYLLDLQKPDGAIYDKELANYCTAIAVQTLANTKDPAHLEALKKARNYLTGSQLDVAEGYADTDPGYGGQGYGSSLRPDLSNTQMVADALVEAEAAGLERDSEAWKRMVVFLTRCQNRSESNELKWSSNDGGAVYAPYIAEGEGSKAGEVTLPDGRKGLRSYGSMTYAFLKSMIYAEISKDDPRVQAAYEWVQKNYTVDENPGMGQEGLFYYLHTMAKALEAYGKDTLVDDKGVEHDWRKDIAEKLLAMQNEDGSWVIKNSRWWENDPVLVTAYATLTLQELAAK
jgi:squalene-hopene/tetraprenyl-beta-curcumene cyclase